MNENGCLSCGELLKELLLLQAEYAHVEEKWRQSEGDRAHLKWVIKRQRKMLEKCPRERQPA